jgi:alpha-glucosidase
VIRKGEAARKIDVDLSGKKVIELRVTDGGDGKNHDHADWADAKFIHGDKAPVMSPRWAMELEHFRGEPATTPAMGSHIIESPDKQVRAALLQSGDRLSIAGLLCDKPFLKTSPLGVTVDGIDLGRSAAITGIERYRTDQTYDWIGNARSLRDESKGWKVSLQSEGHPGTWFLDLRAYNDGIAWRYIIPGKGKRKVTGEATSFVLPEGASYWSHHNTGNYEANYLRFTPQGDSPTRQITMPVTVELPGGGYACITEANMFGYSGMTLGPRGSMLCGIFEDDPKGWTMEGEIVTPSRIVIAAAD